MVSLNMYSSTGLIVQISIRPILELDCPNKNHSALQASVNLNNNLNAGFHGVT